MREFKREDLFLLFIGKEILWGEILERNFRDVGELDGANLDLLKFEFQQVSKLTN